MVTLEPKHGKSIPPIEAQDITVSQGRDKRPITSLTALPFDQGTTQLILLIDDSARGTFDTEINTLKQFVNSQPPNVQVAVAYMRNGMAAFTSQFTSNHASAANSIRVSLGAGGADVSPYDSLADAIKHWPNAGAQRKVAIMISSGIEGTRGGYAPDNMYVNAGITLPRRQALLCIRSTVRVSDTVDIACGVQPGARTSFRSCRTKRGARCTPLVLAPPCPSNPSCSRS